MFVLCSLFGDKPYRHKQKDTDTRTRAHTRTHVTLSLNFQSSKGADSLFCFCCCCRRRCFFFFCCILLLLLLLLLLLPLRLLRSVFVQLLRCEQRYVSPYRHNGQQPAVQHRNGVEGLACALSPHHNCLLDAQRRRVRVQQPAHGLQGLARRDNIVDEHQLCHMSHIGRDIDEHAALQRRHAHEHTTS